MAMEEAVEWISNCEGSGEIPAKEDPFDIGGK